MEIAVYNLTKNKVRVKSLIIILERAAKQLKMSGEVSIVLAGDQRLRSLNQTWRGLDKSTDVLSFSLLTRGLSGGLRFSAAKGAKGTAAKISNNQASRASKKIINGEIFINLADCRRPQKYLDIFEKSASMTEILHFLALHGLLHLVGLKDDTEAGRKMMIKRGLELLK